MPDAIPHDDRLLTLRHVAAVLNVSLRYVRSLRQSGALPVVRLGPKLLRVRPQDLKHFLDERMSARRRA